MRIQLSQIRYSVISEAETKPVPAADPAVPMTDAKAARLAKPTNVERLDLVLEGSAICARPEIEVDAFIKGLREHPVFSKFVKEIRLRSITRVGAVTEAGLVGLPSATFAVDCIYKGAK